MDDPMQRADYMHSRQYAESLLQAGAEEARKWKEALQPKDEVEHRQLQVETLNVAFVDCTFEDNYQGSAGLDIFPILGFMTMTSPFSPTRLENCLITSNTFNGADGDDTGYFIESAGSDVELKGCCLVDNDFIGFAPINVFAGGEFTSENNYASEDDVVLCNFAALSAGPDPQGGDDVTCVEAELDECSFEVPGTPTPEPTNAPSSAPRDALGFISAVLMSVVMSLPALLTL